MCYILAATWWEQVTSRLSFDTRWQTETLQWRSSRGGLQRVNEIFMCICTCLRRWTFSFWLLYYSPKSVSQRKVLVPESARKSCKQWVLRDINHMEVGERTEKLWRWKMVHSPLLSWDTDIPKSHQMVGRKMAPMTSHLVWIYHVTGKKNTSQMW